MKKLLTLLVFTAITAMVTAQAPDKMNYQSVIRNALGELLANSNVGIRISILKDSSSGDAVYVETHAAETNANGLVTLLIGGGTIVTGTLTGIDWSSGPYFLKTETDPTGGTNYTISGVSQLLSVPYALYSKISENAFSGDFTELQNKPNTISGYGITDAISESEIIRGLIDGSNTTIMNGTGFSFERIETGRYKITFNKPFIDVPIATATDHGSANYITGISATNEYLYIWTRLHNGSLSDAQVSFIAIGNQLIEPTDKLTDIDGNHYDTIRIGSQVWLAENLKTTKYNDGTSIPLVTDNTTWSNLTTPGYCWYDNNPTNGDTYGALYNWHTVNTGKLCPSGWHVPTDAEWTTLTTYLGGLGVAGGKLKEAGTTHWLSPNTGATNETGFTAIPGGYREVTFSAFYGIGYSSGWWSATENDATNVWYRDMSYNDSGVYRDFFNKKYGLYVRCIKD